MAEGEKDNHFVTKSSDSSCDRIIHDTGHIHNSSEFIDIHGIPKDILANSNDPGTFSYQQKPTIPADCSFSSDHASIDENDPTKNKGVNKLPMQETNKNDIEIDNVVSNYKYEKRKGGEQGDDDESDEDAYESAEEDKNCEEDEEISDEFIPINEVEKDACLKNLDQDFQSMNFGDCADKQDDSDTEDQSEEIEKEEELQNEDEKIARELEGRKTAEALLTDEERQERKEKAQTLKNNGNVSFRQSEYDDAISAYTEALNLCPLEFHKERAIMFANRAACKLKQEFYEAAITDSTEALELHPQYLKAMLRRAELYEKTEKLDEALKDYQKVVELDPSQYAARAACVRLAEQIKDRNEKMKEEMMGKLKDLGNMVLRPFGLSVNNFNLQQDPNTGSYSVQFQQNPSGNGK